MRNLLLVGIIVCSTYSLYATSSTQNDTIFLESGVKYILVIGEDELSSGHFTLKELSTKEEKTGPIEELVNLLT